MQLPIILLRILTTTLVLSSLPLTAADHRELSHTPSTREFWSIPGVGGKQFKVFTNFNPKKFDERGNSVFCDFSWKQWATRQRDGIGYLQAVFRDDNSGYVDYFCGKSIPHSDPRLAGTYELRFSKSDNAPKITAIFSKESKTLQPLSPRTTPQVPHQTQLSHHTSHHHYAPMPNPYNGYYQQSYYPNPYEYQQYPAYPSMYPQPTYYPVMISPSAEPIAISKTPSLIDLEQELRSADTTDTRKHEIRGMLARLMQLVNPAPEGKKIDPVEPLPEIITPPSTIQTPSEIPAVIPLSGTAFLELISSDKTLPDPTPPLDSPSPEASPLKKQDCSVAVSEPVDLSPQLPPCTENKTVRTKKEIRAEKDREAKEKREKEQLEETLQKERRTAQAKKDREAEAAKKAALAEEHKKEALARKQAKEEKFSFEAEAPLSGPVSSKKQKQKTQTEDSAIHRIRKKIEKEEKEKAAFLTALETIQELNKNQNLIIDSPILEQFLTNHKERSFALFKEESLQNLWIGFYKILLTKNVSLSNAQFKEITAIVHSYACSEIIELEQCNPSSPESHTTKTKTLAYLTQFAALTESTSATRDTIVKFIHNPQITPLIDETAHVFLSFETIAKHATNKETGFVNLDALVKLAIEKSKTQKTQSATASTTHTPFEDSSVFTQSLITHFNACDKYLKTMPDQFRDKQHRHAYDKRLEAVVKPIYTIIDGIKTKEEVEIFAQTLHRFKDNKNFYLFIIDVMKPNLKIFGPLWDPYREIIHPPTLQSLALDERTIPFSLIVLGFKNELTQFLSDKPLDKKNLLQVELFFKKLIDKIPESDDIKTVLKQFETEDTLCCCIKMLLEDLIPSRYKKLTHSRQQELAHHLKKHLTTQIKTSKTKPTDALTDYRDMVLKAMKTILTDSNPAKQSASAAVVSAPPRNASSTEEYLQKKIIGYTQLFLGNPHSIFATLTSIQKNSEQEALVWLAILALISESTILSIDHKTLLQEQAKNYLSRIEKVFTDPQTSASFLSILRTIQPVIQNFVVSFNSKDTPVKNNTAAESLV